MDIERKLTPSQVAAVRKGEEVAVLLVEDLPQIAQEYRKGKYQGDIIKAYEICRRYNVTPAVARSALFNALRVLIDPSELETIAKNNMQRGGEFRGSVSQQLNQGIFGEFDRDKRQWSVDSAIAGKLSAFSRAQVPWVEREETDRYVLFSELEYAQALSVLPAYKKGGYVNNKKIAEQLNNTYHRGEKIRTPMAVASILSRARNKK